MPEPTLLHDLAALLRSRGVRPVVSPDRVAPSTVYDTTYRTAILACAFELHTKVDLSNAKRIQTARLKLLQFVAIRPWLVAVLREWSAARNTQLGMSSSQRARRGFLGDTMYDRLIDYLVAQEILSQTRTHLIIGTRGDVLQHIFSAVTKDNLFTAERSALMEMATIRITNDMLEGW